MPARTHTVQELPSDVTMRVDPVLRGRQEDGHHQRVRRTSDSSPAVSVIIPARNAAVTVADVSDGPATAETVRRVVPTAHVVPNPDQHTAAGLNAARRATKAPIVVRVDAHVRLPPGYLRRTTATLARTGAANVGGRQQPVGSSFFTRAVAVAQMTLLGTGNARYRQGGVEGPTDTVYLGAFRRDAVEAVGGFDDALRCNRDYDLNWRLRQRGETIWFDPALVVVYRPRQDLRKLARQYFNYGRWKRVVLRRHPRSLRLRQIRGSPAGARIGRQCGACRSRGQEYRGGGSAGLSGHVGRLVAGGGRAAP